MAKPRLFVTRLLPDAVEERIRRDYDAILNPEDRPYTPDDLVRLAAGVDGILTTSAEKWPAEIIARLPERVRIIASFSVGYEHIDLEACRKRGIVATNTPDVLTEATADIAMLCLLGAARRAWEAETMLRQRRWERWKSTELLGLELSGRVLGIVGMGRIGLATARRARGFGMVIHYHNRRRLPADKEEGAVYHATLEELLPHCHFLSLNAPGGAETHHLLDARTIELLPQGAVVVNTARGTLIDDEALIAALRSGRLFAAGLDVFAGEPNIHPGYYDLPNCFLLPHIGSATIETRNAMGFRALDNLDAFFAGRPAPDALT
ncbi:2-hydroxyacid dehydrogenase [Benzoatithermus flavus]|uniref:D-glycerate dehydrogenase n=1 Tax=Benzoatithermus flavus TaxID=3108223 RepID=A0ABU8XQK7_9PROT